MKQKFILLFVMSIFMLSCGGGDESSSDLKEYTLTNSTDYNLKVTAYINGSESSFEVGANQTKKIKLDDVAVPSVGKPAGATSSFFGYYENNKGDQYNLTLYSYNYHIQYKITGTAKSADLTYSEPNGGTGQMSDVKLPHTIYYKNFSEKFYYISAQNNDEKGGAIKVEILFNERPYKSGNATGFASIATASGR